jgi:hypothetical protein
MMQRVSAGGSSAFEWTSEVTAEGNMLFTRPLAPSTTRMHWKPRLRAVPRGLQPRAVAKPA